VASDFGTSFWIFFFSQPIQFVFSNLYPPKFLPSPRELRRRMARLQRRHDRRRRWCYNAGLPGSPCSGWQKFRRLRDFCRVRRRHRRKRDSSSKILSQHTRRLDLAFPIHAITRVMHNPCQKHLDILIHLCRCVCSTQSWDLCYHDKKFSRLSNLLHLIAPRFNVNRLGLRNPKGLDFSPVGANMARVPARNGRLQSPDLSEDATRTHRPVPVL
jgi:hypothetical protein